MKKRLALASLLLVPLVLSGCLVISSVSSFQLNTIGNITIQVNACFSQTAGSCTDKGNSGDAAGGFSHQPLIAFRIPSTASAPDSFATTAGVTLTFSRSTEYTQKLQTLDPAPSGQQWVGYMATTAVAVTDGANQTLTVSPEFALDSNADGSPFTGPFLYRPVIGSRVVTGTLLIGRALDCGTSLFAPNSTTLVDTICIDSPSQVDTATNLSRTTRDLGVVASAPVNTTRGSTATVPFLLKYAGTSTASANFAIDASTSLSGATATVSQGSLLPASDSSNPISVSVSVPAGAAYGTYDVVLNARLSNGQARTNTGHFVVRDVTKPTVTISLVKRQTARTLLKRGLKLKVKMSEAGKVTFSLSTKLPKTVTLSKKTVSYTGAGTKTVTLTVKKSALSASKRARLLSLSRVKLILRASAKDTAGNTRSVTKKYTLKH